MRPSHVVHLAAVGATEPFLPIEEANRVNLTGTIHVLEASQAVGIERFLHVGTAYEHSAASSQQAHNPYVASKSSRLVILADLHSRAHARCGGGAPVLCVRARSKYAA